MLIFILVLFGIWAQACKIKKGIGGVMTNYLKRKKLAAKLFIISCLFAALIVSGNSARAAAEYSASLETDRSNGVCTYTVNGIDTSVVKEMTLKVTYTDNAANNGSSTSDNNENTDSNNGNEDNTDSTDNKTDNPDNASDADNNPENNGSNTDNNNPDGNTGSAAAGNKGNSATDGNTTGGSTDNTVITALEQKITDRKSVVEGKSVG